ncbi:MAG: 2-C-methyl-D-erythritol 4-phosphate cytidylyltransferase [Acutalibacteraceae bacterium]
MIFAVIVAGGIGSRMGNLGKPKQYVSIKGKPIIIHTLEKFYINSAFDKVLVLCPSNWVTHTKDLIKKYIPMPERVVVLTGGPTRNETIMNSIDYIEKTYGLDDETIVVTHDSVRPFVTARIINENIEAAMEYGACDTVICATDTIIESTNGITIDNIPDRRNMYQGQTPQSFKALQLKELYNSLTDEEKDSLTDAAKIFSIKNKPVHLVTGESYNIKITYPYDLRVASALLDEDMTHD